jgi:hypothetical protein
MSHKEAQEEELPQKGTKSIDRKPLRAFCAFLAHAALRC